MHILIFIIIIVTLSFLTFKIKQENISMRTLVWPYLMLAAMFIITYEPILNFLTKLLGFERTENLIFFIVCGYLFVLTIVQEIRIAKLHEKTNKLTRYIAIHMKKEK